MIKRDETIRSVLLGLSWWNHLWGWLFVVAAIGIALFERGALRRRREILDLI